MNILIIGYSSIVRNRAMQAIIASGHFDRVDVATTKTETHLADLLKDADVLIPLAALVGAPAGGGSSDEFMSLDDKGDKALNEF